MCDALGFAPNCWSIAGLATDFVGVLLLGVDLVRLQSLLRRHAQENLDRFEEMEDAYGGITGWSDEIQKN
jgi:hypothetical protein